MQSVVVLAAAVVNDDDNDDDDDTVDKNIQVSVELGRALAPRQFCIVVSVKTRCRRKHAPVLCIHIDALHTYIFY